MAATCKRILFVTPPGYGHVFPIVPFAWAVRAAGHAVLVATAGVSVQAAIRAGLAAINVAPDADLPAIQRRHTEGFTHVFPLTHPEAALGTTTGVFADFADVMTDGVVRAAREWRADAIVYTPEAGAALIAATRLSIPAVLFCVGLGHTPALMVGRYAAMADTSVRHGVTRLDDPVAWIDLAPPSLRRASSDGWRGWPLRYVQYNGGAIWEPGELTRSGLTGDGLTRNGRCVAVTFGSVTPFVTGLTPLRRVIESAADVDATFVVAHGSTSARELGELPPNVRASAWIALDALLATCRAVVHHGGFGTSMAALCTGLPQLLLPQGADQFYNANLLEQRGAALVVGTGSGNGSGALDAGMLRRLLEDEGLRAAAEDVRDEIASLPPPSEVAPSLIGLLR